MRWQEPKDGDEKIVKKFALLPITLGRETRWLEFVTIKYIYAGYHHIRGCWYPDSFID